MKEEFVRDYRMPDSDLAFFGIELGNYMTRDLVEFTAKGIVAGDITALTAKANEFLIYPNDAFYEGQVMQYVLNKNAHRESIQLRIRDIIGMATIKWGSRSPNVHTFYAGDLTSKGDHAFLGIASQAVATATSYLADLTPLGLTQVLIDALEAECAAMSADMSQESIKDAERVLATQGRVELGNELYALVAKYCEIGKIIWDDVDPGKYVNYVITDFPPGVPGKIMSMTFVSQTQTISWSAESSANEYQLEYSVITPQLHWIEVYRGPMTSFIHPMGPGQLVYRCRGINSNGYGYWSDNLIVTRV